jgi:hypothetical protein
MRARPLILGTVLALAAAVIIYHRPYFRGAKILSAETHPEVTRYAQEFADALSVSMHWNTGEPLSEPYFYLRGGGATSPDGRFTLRQRKLRNYYYEITVASDRAPPETVLVLQEGDPGSGTSHDWQWSRDSKAVFIYGSGTPAGRAYANNLALIYIVGQRSLYAINLSQLLSRRLKGKTNTLGSHLEY